MKTLVGFIVVRFWKEEIRGFLAKNHQKHLKKGGKVPKKLKKSLKKGFFYSLYFMLARVVFLAHVYNAC